MRRTFPLLLLATPAAAQEQQDVVVTGRGLNERPGDAAFDIVTLDAERLAQSADGRLEGALEDVAGLQQFRRADARSANPTSQGITLRGLGGNAASRALLLLDGVPQADPFGGWVAFPAYALGRLGRVRVTRGGGSGYYGAGALAGTIELESATPAQLPGLGGRTAYGSRDALDADGAVLFQRAGGFATVSAAYARGDGFVPVVMADRGPADRAAPYEQASGAVRGVLDLGVATELQANFSGFSDRRERGTAFSSNRSEGADASVRLVGRGRWGWSALAYLQARAFASRFAAVDVARATVTPTLDQYNTPATGVGGRLELVPPVGSGRDLRLGVDWRRVGGRTQENFTYVAGVPTRRRVAGGVNETLGAFADGSATLGAVTLALGGRVDAWRIADGFRSERPLAGGAALTDARFADRTGTEATGRAGVAWQVAAPLSLRGAAYRGWRLPTLNELYRPFRVGPDATAANDALAPERLRGAEAGVALTPVRGASVSATVFRNELRGGIANVTAGQGPGQFSGVGFVAAGGVYRVRRNVDAIRSDGLELDARWHLGEVTALASWSHVSPRLRASGSAAGLDGLRPAQTPRDQLSATLGWQRGARALSATMRHSAGQFDDDQNLRRLASATTLDSYLAWPLTPRLTLEVRAENVTDRTIETAISGADVLERASPRTLWLGLRLR